MDKILNETNAKNLNAGLSDIVNQISKTSKNDLIHYIALRKHVLTLFEKSFELNEDQKYPSEGTVHDIISLEGEVLLVLNLRIIIFG